MRFLVDENVPREAVVALQDAGIDETWIRTHNPGMHDSDVLALAAAEQRILLTFDTDFGQLAFHKGMPCTCGIVLFRTPIASADDAARHIVSTILSRSDWAGHFTVVEPGRIRMKQLG
jgi:predicted nuclease of predicted toxin-antitoxin system